MQTETLLAGNDPESRRRQLLEILVSGLRRHIHQAKLQRPKTLKSSETYLEFSPKPRLSVSQPAHETGIKDTQDENEQRQ